ncbi:PIN/TRAM domain-containing protein [Caenicola nitritireducens]|uniref:PIN/TRAM domain-containing protein n=2 Tax=Synergistaceae TaxID=649777 RepID=UPI003C7CA535|nr:TRAM domain-containing protein [Synergistaceae bacterium DZ-S4]
MKGENKMSSGSGLSAVMKRLVRAVMVFICAAAGYQISKIVIEQNWWPSVTLLHPIATTVFIIILSACFGFILAPLFWFSVSKFAQFTESKLQNTSVPELTVSLLGLILGLLLANLIAMPMSRIPGGIGVYIAVLLNVALGYLGLRFFAKRKDDIWGVITNIGDIKLRLPKRKKKSRNGEEEKETDIEVAPEFYYSIPKILDTSAIIDGRILDVAQSGFLEGTIVLPRFILAELQGVADSTDPLRRTRGRRGLAVVTELQKIRTLNIEIPETTLKDLEREKVDEALVVLARQLNGKVITTDYNLNQIAQIEGVSVLNVNDLANSLKPMLLPGENVEIDIIRIGKEAHQGVGYLDDGTMLVVEDGYKRIGERVKVTVTSMLQTSAGRMVFGRIRP